MQKEAKVQTASVEVERQGTPRANAKVVEEMYAALARRDVERVRAYFSPDYRHHSNGRELNFDELMQTAMLGFAAFPDLTSEVVETLAEDERVMVRLEFKGTHTGEVLGIPPSGRPVAWSILNIFVVRDGVIVEDTPYWDIGVIFRQLGVEAASYGF